MIETVWNFFLNEVLVWVVLILAIQVYVWIYRSRNGRR